MIDQLAPDQEAVQTAKKKNNTKDAKSVKTILTTNNEDSTEDDEVEISEFHGEVAAQAAWHEELTYETFDSIFLDCSSDRFKEGFSWKSSNTKYPAIIIKNHLFKKCLILIEVEIILKISLRLINKIHELRNNFIK